MTGLYIPPLSPIMFGDGSDGAANFDGSATVLTLVPASMVYTLTRDIYCTNLIVGSGVTIRTAGFCIFFSGILSGSGRITAKGNDAVGATAGALFSLVGTLKTSAGGGGNGRSDLGAGSNASGSGGNNIGGGTGGAGGQADGGNAGGAGGTSSAPAAGAGTIRDMSVLYRRTIIGSATAGFSGSTGGGGGGCNPGTGTATSGGGGGAAHGLIVCGRVWDWTGTLDADGGAGASAVATGDGKAGGGGGGPGGWLLAIGEKGISKGTIRAAGGALGTGVGGGSNGVAGTAGLVVQFFYS